MSKFQNTGPIAPVSAVKAANKQRREKIPPPSAPKGYRWLRPGEKRTRADLYFNHGTNQWENSGLTYPVSVYCGYIRKLTRKKGGRKHG